MRSAARSVSVSTLSVPHAIPSNSSGVRLASSQSGNSRHRRPDRARRRRCAAASRSPRAGDRRSSSGMSEPTRMRGVDMRIDGVEQSGCSAREHPGAEIAAALRQRGAAPAGERAISGSASSGVKKIVTSGRPLERAQRIGEQRGAQRGQPGRRQMRREPGLAAGGRRASHHADGGAHARVAGRARGSAAASAARDSSRRARRAAPRRRRRRSAAG